jgi:hypothetical protein
VVAAKFELLPGGSRRSAVPAEILQTSWGRPGLAVRRCPPIVTARIGDLGD